MNIIKQFKAAGKPTALFFEGLAQSDWTQDDVGATCVYAARHNHPQLFVWAYARVDERNKASVGQKSLKAASLSGNDFVLNATTIPLQSYSLSQINQLLTNAAQKGYEHFVESLVVCAFRSASPL